jgi:hypothetical protein
MLPVNLSKEFRSELDRLKLVHVNLSSIAKRAGHEDATLIDLGLFRIDGGIKALELVLMEDDANKDSNTLRS